jgi:heme-degrading monooxygenase HmoA
MYARLLRFAIGSGKREIGQQVADEIGSLISAQPGCQSVTVFGDDTDGEYGIFVLWDTDANANAAAQVVRPKLNEVIGAHVKTPPDARLFQVLSK